MRRHWVYTLHCQCTFYKEGNWLYMTIWCYDRNKRIHWFFYLYLKMTNTTQSWTTMRAMFSRLEISQSTQRQRPARIVAQTSLQFRACNWKLIFLFLIQNISCGYSENHLDELDPKHKLCIMAILNNHVFYSQTVYIEMRTGHQFRICYKTLGMKFIV